MGEVVKKKIYNVIKSVLIQQVVHNTVEQEGFYHPFRIRAYNAYLTLKLSVK